MRELSELEKFNVDYLADQEIPFVAVMMTENILSHAIFDATRQIVTFLKQNAIHDYSQQEKGTDYRKFIPTHILTFKEEIMSRSSLYKAGTRGDKRMWFGAEILPFVDSDNLILILAKAGELYVINASKIDIEYCCSTGLNNPIKNVIRNMQ